MDCLCVRRIALVSIVLWGGVLLWVGATCARAQAQRETAAVDSAGPAAALPSRAARWRAKRRAKAKTISPPQPGVLERVVSTVSQIGGAVVPHRLILRLPQLDVSGFHPVFGGLGGNAGTTAGILYEPPFWQGPRRLAEVEGLGSIHRYYGLGARVGGRLGSYVGYAYVRYQHRPRDTFYGLGPNSEADTKAGFRLDQAVAGGLLGRRFGPDVLLGTHVSYQQNRYGPGHGDEPNVPELFGERVLGRRSNPDYILVGAFFEVDSRDASYDRTFGHRFAPTQPRLRGVSLGASQGFYFATEVTHNQAVNHPGQSFTRWTFDVREFLPIREDLLHGVSIRQFASLTRAAGSHVPFYRLQSIGGDRSLRGYASNRFRDRNVVLANAEVRCQVWHWLDMAVFGDAGHVFTDVQTLRQAQRVGYGVGFRIRNDGKTLGRADIAHGAEGWRLHLDLGSLF